MTLDFAIIGAGISGLYAGLRLAQNQFANAANSMIFEADQSIGGRLQTRYTGKALPLNLGAHRFNTHKQLNMKYLLQDLQIPCEPMPYKLAKNYYGCIEKQAFDRVQYIKKTLRQLYQHTINPYKINFNQIFEGDLTSKDLILLKRYTGYDVLDHKNLSFAEAIRILDEHPESERLNGDAWQQTTLGVQSIVTRLSQLLHANDIPIRLKHKLIDIAVAADSKSYILTFETENGMQQFHTKKLILALAKEALCKLAFIKARFSKLLEAIETVSLFKAFLYYPEPFWTERRPFYIISENELRKIYFSFERNEVSFYADSAAAKAWHDLILENQQDALHRISSNLCKLLKYKKSIPKPSEFFYKYWPDGVSFWKTAYNVKKLNQACIDNDDGIHFIGDMFSPQSGWMEGALTNVMQLIEYLNTWRKAS